MAIFKEGKELLKRDKIPNFKFSYVGDKIYIANTKENREVFSAYILDHIGEVIQEEDKSRFDTWVYIKFDNECILKIHTDDLDFVKFLVKKRKKKKK